MSNEAWAEKPISESTFYILLSLSEPLHGYGIMKKVTEMSQGTVSLGAGTLYGTLSKLAKAKFIRKVAEEDRRKIYSLTQSGKEYLLFLIERLTIMSQNGNLIAKSWQDATGEEGIS